MERNRNTKYLVKQQYAKLIHIHAVKNKRKKTLKKLKVFQFLKMQKN